MKNLILLLTLFTSFNAMSQVLWYSDLKTAKSVAISENKFIVMDFWATWCGPCKKMDKEMWNTEEMASISQGFIGLKIDIDRQQRIAQAYGIKSIPTVIMIDPNENIIWKNEGYSSPYGYLEIFKSIPSNTLRPIDQHAVVNGEDDENTWNSLADGYQQIAINTASKKLKLGFLRQGDKYYKKTIKKGTDEKNIEFASINLILNDVYRGNTKKALKQALKVQTTNEELKNFVLAYCYKCENQNSEMEKYKALVNDPELLAKLE